MAVLVTSALALGGAAVSLAGAPNSTRNLIYAGGGAGDHFDVELSTDGGATFAYYDTVSGASSWVPLPAPATSIRTTNASGTGLCSVAWIEQDGTVTQNQISAALNLPANSGPGVSTDLTTVAGGVAWLKTFALTNQQPGDLVSIEVSNDNANWTQPDGALIRIPSSGRGQGSVTIGFAARYVRGNVQYGTGTKNTQILQLAASENLQSVVQYKNASFAPTLPGVYNVDASAGAVDVTLPDVTQPGISGVPFTFVKVDSTQNPVTLIPHGTQLIDSRQLEPITTPQRAETLVGGSALAAGDANWSVTWINASNTPRWRRPGQGTVRVGGPPYLYSSVNQPSSTGLSGPALGIDSSHQLATATTGAVNHNVAGFDTTSATPQCWWTNTPLLEVTLRTGASIANQRVWVALANGLGLSGNGAGGSDGTGAFATEYIGFRFSTAAGDVNWQLCSGDGANGSAIDTGVPVQANTTYHFVLDYSGLGQLVGHILTAQGVTGASKRKTTNLPTLQHNVNLGVTIETLSAAAVTCYPGNFTLDMDF